MQRFRRAAHNFISIMSFSIAILAAAGFVEAGGPHWLVKALIAYGYALLWLYAQITPWSDGKWRQGGFIDDHMVR